MLIRHNGQLLTFAGKVLKMFKWVYQEGMHYFRVVDGGGDISDRVFTEDYYKMSEENKMYENILIAVFPQSGSKITVNGIYKTVSKLFSLTTTPNDPFQNTTIFQPYYVRKGMKSLDNENRIMHHQPIVFAGNQAWSWTGIFRPNGPCYIHHSEVNNSSKIELKTSPTSGNSNIVLTNSIGQAVNFGSDSALPMYGRSNVLTIISDGDGTMSVYVNGILVEAKQMSTQFIFSMIMGATLRPFNGTFYGEIIRSGGMTLAQMANEVDFLKTYFPDMESIAVSKRITVENFEASVTVMGRAINMQADPNVWESADVLYQNVYNSTDGTDYEKKSAALAVAAMWMPRPTNDLAIFGKLYNGYAAELVQMDIEKYNELHPDNPYEYRVTNTNDWLSISNQLGGKGVAGKKIKINGSDYWMDDNGSNSSGISALGSGYVNSDGGYRDRLILTGFWTTDESDGALEVVTLQNNKDELIFN